MMPGYLRLIVMKTLLGRKLSGYGLIKQIEKDTGTWKPSFGSIYPLMEKLLKEKLVECEIDGRKKIYCLTKEGKKRLSTLEMSKNKVVDDMITAWKTFGKITDENEANFMQEIFSSLKNNQLPFKDLNQEINQFRAGVYEAYSKGKDRKKMKIILRNAISEMKSIK